MIDKSWEKASDDYCRKENGEYYTDVDIKPMKGAFYYGASRFQDKAITTLETYIYGKANSKDDLDYNSHIKLCIEILKNLKAVD